MNNFENFWRIYPRKVGKRAAFQAFSRACKRADEAAIMEGLHRYAKDPERIRKGVEFTAHAATWLNQDRWLDEPAPESRSAPFVDVVARFENEPDGITFEEWLKNHATAEEIEKARQFGVARQLEEVAARASG